MISCQALVPLHSAREFSPSITCNYNKRQNNDSEALSNNDLILSLSSLSDLSPTNGREFELSNLQSSEL